MSDRSAFWSAPPDWQEARIARPGLQIAVRGEPCTLVSGNTGAWLAAQGIAPAIGPREDCPEGPYALRLAPDSVLVVGMASAEEGWQAEQCVALSPCSDGWLVFEILGEDAAALMAEGSEYRFSASPGLPTESARLLFAGVVVAVARCRGGWRLHVERAWAPALWCWLAR
ncbi:MAG: hypothetical protein ACKPE6_11015 [Gammaproteobacteria bacterium]